MRFRNSFARQDEIAFRPKYLYRFLMWLLLVGPYLSILWYYAFFSGLSILRREVGGGRLFVIPVTCFALYIFVLLNAKVLFIGKDGIREWGLCVQDSGYQCTGWSLFAKIKAEEYWFPLFGFVLLLHTEEHPFAGLYWLSGWRKTRALRKAMRENWEKSGGQYSPYTPFALTRKVFAHIRPVFDEWYKATFHSR